MNTYAQGRLTSEEAANIASNIITGQFSDYIDHGRPTRRCRFAYHLYYLGLAFRNTKGDSPYCQAASALFRAVIIQTDLLETVDHRDWKAVTFLQLLCRYHDSWVRSPETWRPADGLALRAKLRSLVRHLFAEYPLPPLWDEVWFREGRDIDYDHLDWYVQLSAGKSFRSLANLPVRLTKKAAHLLMDAPSGLSVPKAIRWAQLLSNDISKQTIGRVLQFSKTPDFSNDDVMLPLFRLFDQQASTEFHAPLFTYINCRRGLSSNYQIKGKTYASLVREMDQFYERFPEYSSPAPNQTARRTKKRRKVQHVGGHTSYKPLEAYDSEEDRLYIIIEIKKSFQLATEGRRMQHCVGSYVGKCISGQASIWSLRSQKDDKWETHVTIEVDPRTRRMIQAKTRCNGSPTDSDWSKIELWARSNGIKIDC